MRIRVRAKARGLMRVMMTISWHEGNIVVVLSDM